MHCWCYRQITTSVKTCISLHHQFPASNQPYILNDGQCTPIPVNNQLPHIGTKTSRFCFLYIANKSLYFTSFDSQAPMSLKLAILFILASQVAAQSPKSECYECFEYMHRDPVNITRGLPCFKPSEKTEKNATTDYCVISKINWEKNDDCKLNNLKTRINNCSDIFAS